MDTLQAVPPHERAFAFHPFLHAWQMPYAERYTMLALLSTIRPACALEVGTADGGSLAVLAQFAERVYSIDPDPTCAARLGPRLPNVTFVTGYSQEQLPRVLAAIEHSDRPLEFVLIDGDHRREAVRRDIDLLLAYKPRAPLWVVLHDSFNPGCRLGMLEAAWESSPYVHTVDLDYVPGVLSDHPRFFRQMWNGLALASLGPQPRDGALIVQRSANLHFEAARRQSIHGNRVLHLMQRLRLRARRAR
jgi:hypothetical protein